MTSQNTTRLTLAARRWAIDPGGAITLRKSPRGGGSAMMPVAQAHEPNDPAEYEREVVDDVTVYRRLSIPTDIASPIRIDFAGLWRWRRLIVEGIDIVSGRVKES